MVLIGPPGSGKGTQAAALVRRRGMVHVSAGDLLRDAIRSGDDIGREAKENVDRGELVPDELVGRLIERRLDEAGGDRGAVFDGFPRSVEQVGMLDEILERRGRKVDAAVHIKLSDDEVVRRLGGRFVCSACGAVVSAALHAVEGNRCPFCGADALVQRDDDSEDTIRNRLSVYREKTLPVLDEYRGRGVLFEVEGNSGAGPEEVGMRIEGVLSEALS